MSKVCRFFHTDFEYFLAGNDEGPTDEQTGHNIITDLPENFPEEFKKLVERNQAHEKVIEELKNQINGKI